MDNLNEAIIVSCDFTRGVDTGVVIVGRKRLNGTVEIINAFQGEEAEALWNKLTIKEKKHEQET